MAGTSGTNRGKIAILVENDYQEMEVWVPLYRLREEGYETVLVGPQAARYLSKHGYPATAQMPASEARAD
ncbi:MAG TPA: DJ-1/PfpI family protein, partial [Candidatus Polarisedimenticolia bacterium]|nr:DJ-1/PfpI family protein [Candidatus Polarisedimenticolia bacterium]